jgi:hypothetical protein
MGCRIWRVRVAAGHRSGGVAGCGSFAPELIARARHSQAGLLRRLSNGKGWRGVRRRLWHGNPFGVIYSTFMTRTPVDASARPSGIPFPFNIRYLQAGWKLLLFRPSRFEPGPEKAHFWKHKTCRCRSTLRSIVHKRGRSIKRRSVRFM